MNTHTTPTTRESAFAFRDGHPDGLFAVRAGVPVDQALQRALTNLEVVDRTLCAGIAAEEKPGDLELEAMRVLVEQVRGLIEACMYAHKRVAKEGEA